MSQRYSGVDRPSALALIGDRWHSPVYIRDNLISSLVKENIPTTFIEDATLLNADALRKHQLLIFLRDGVNWPHGYEQPPVQWMTDEQQKAIWDFVSDGGGFLALHNAHGRFPEGGLYYKILGCDSGSHPPPHVFTVRVEDHNHEIMKDIEDFEIFDEQHILKYNLDPKHILMSSMARDGLTSAAGWWQEIGKGRFCYFAPGHTPDALGHPTMQKLLRNSYRWLLRY